MIAIFKQIMRDKVADDSSFYNQLRYLPKNYWLIRESTVPGMITVIRQAEDNKFVKHRLAFKNGQWDIIGGQTVPPEELAKINYESVGRDSLSPEKEKQLTELLASKGLYIENMIKPPEESRSLQYYFSEAAPSGKDISVERFKFCNETDINIYKYPAVDELFLGDEGAQITIGDLHSNTMNLLFSLVKHGITTNLCKNDYKELVEIYKLDCHQLTEHRLNRFREIINNTSFNNNATIRLIGDELADRGQNDYFTLKVLEKLHSDGVNVEILLSNHSIEFIDAQERGENFHAPILNNIHANSLEVMNWLLTRDTPLINSDEINAMANNAYKRFLKLISYSLSPDNKQITLYSHAGIGLNTIRAIAEKFELSYKDKTIIDLAQTIDAINNHFQENYVKRGLIHTLYTRAQMQIGYGGEQEITDNPIVYLMWNRFYTHINRPATYHNYNINFVHGHDSQELTKHNIAVIDPLLGKNVRQNKGDYCVLYSHDTNLAQRLRMESIEFITKLFPNLSDLAANDVLNNAPGLQLLITYLVNNDVEKEDISLIQDGSPSSSSSFFVPDNRRDYIKKIANSLVNHLVLGDDFSSEFKTHLLIHEQLYLSKIYQESIGINESMSSLNINS